MVIPVSLENLDILDTVVLESQDTVDILGVEYQDTVVILAIVGIAVTQDQVYQVTLDTQALEFQVTLV